jgi:hypothetical protein
MRAPQFISYGRPRLGMTLVRLRPSAVQSGSTKENGTCGRPCPQRRNAADAEMVCYLGAPPIRLASLRRTNTARAWSASIVPESDASVDVVRQTGARLNSQPDRAIPALLALRFRDPEDPGLALRREHLRRAFEQLEPSKAAPLFERLKRGDARDSEYGGFTRLATPTRTELLAILKRKLESVRGTRDRGVPMRATARDTRATPAAPYEAILPRTGTPTQAARLGVALNEQRLKEMAIRTWVESPDKRPVKVVKLTSAFDPVKGYFTTHQAIAGQTPAEMEQTLGLKTGTLAGGAVVQELARLPKASEFELRGYTQTPEGRAPVPGGWPAGTGVPQWRVSEGVEIPVASATPVPPDYRYRPPLRYQPGPGWPTPASAAPPAAAPRSQSGAPPAPASELPLAQRVAGRAANWGAFALSAISLYLGDKLAEQERENMKQSWKLWVQPYIEKELAALEEEWRRNPRSYPDTTTYLTVVYSISFEKSSHWLIGDAYFVNDVRYVSSVIGRTRIEQRMIPGPVTQFSRIKEANEGIPTFQMWATSIVVADPQGDARKREEATLRRIEERTVGPPGQREFISPGGGRVPEY